MTPSRIGIAFHHPLAFYAGTASIIAGVLLHLPGYLGAASMGYRLVGMPMGPEMYIGMGLILSGIALSTYGLIPRGASLHGPGHTSDIHLHAMDHAKLTGAHWGLLLVLGVALVVDVMKPATLGFVVPGMRGEYGLSPAQIPMLPTVALAGTTIGSFLWGILSDRIGRRATILLASLLFIATSICGFMPSFGWNLFMCFLMGISAGGMLPIVYALMAESIPAKKRGWLVVLHAGMATVGGYLVASGLAALLEPHFAWRILWFAGLPTGLLVLLLNRWIPESPRFLLEHGRVAEAEAVMARYGVVIERKASAGEMVAPAAQAALPIPHRGTGMRLGQLFRRPFFVKSSTVATYGLGWGLVNWGFLMFIPAILEGRGIAVGSASRILFLSALIAIPGTVLVAYLYGMWSSKKSMILFAVVAVLALVGFAVLDPGSGGVKGPWLFPLMVLLLVGSGGVISMLSPYTAEVYPTRLRGTGSGLAAGSSKFGGILAPSATAALLAFAPGFTTIGLVLAVPLALSVILLAVAGVETRDRALEEVAEASTAAPSAPVSAA